MKSCRFVFLTVRRVCAALVVGASFVFAGIVTPAANSETLKVAVPNFPEAKGNPYQGRLSTPMIYILPAYYQQLTRIGDSGETVPSLATSWENVNPTTWRFRLRENVQFSNGEPFDAEAVKATYDWWYTEVGKATVQGKDMGQFVTDIIVVEPYLLELRTPSPDPLLPKRLAQPSIVAKKAWADVGPEGFTINPIGTGPYVTTFKPESARGTANPTSWKPIADVTEIEFVVIADATARSQALISEQVDVDVSVSQESVERLKQAGIKTYARPSTRTIGVSLVSFRSGKPVDGPLSDVRVRRALNYAVNKQAIVDNLLGGSGKPASQSAAPIAFGYNPNIEPYPYDPVKAKQLLAEAGYPNGFKFEMQGTEGTLGNLTWRLAYDSALADLEKIGIETALNATTFALWVKNWLAGDWPYDGLALGSDNGATYDAGRAFNYLSSCKKDPPFYCDQAEVPLIDQANQEFDPVKRAQILGELLAMQAKNAALLYLVEFDEIMGYNARIKNFGHVALWISYDELELE